MAKDGFIREMNLAERIERLDSLERKYSAALAFFFRDAPKLFREARKANGWSQRALAELLEVDYTYISKIENGHLRPGLPTVRKFGELLKKAGVK